MPIDDAQSRDFDTVLIFNDESYFSLYVAPEIKLKLDASLLIPYKDAESDYQLRQAAQEMTMSLCVCVCLVSCSLIFCLKSKDLSLQLCNFATLQHCNFATLQHCNFAPLQLCNFSPLKLCSFAILQLCNIATLQHCNFATLQL